MSNEETATIEVPPEVRKIWADREKAAQRRAKAEAAAAQAAAEAEAVRRAGLKKAGRPFGTKRGTTRYLTAQELKAFMAQVDRDTPGNALIMKLCFWFGMRVSEVVALRWEDISLTSAQVTIKAMKQGLVRTYDLPALLYKELKHYAKFRGDSQWVFQRRHRRSFQDLPLTAHAAQQMFYRVAKAAGIRGHSIHDLRHTRAMVMAMAGDPLPLIAGWLRHRDVGSSLKYLTAVTSKEHEETVMKRDERFL